MEDGVEGGGGRNLQRTEGENDKRDGRRKDKNRGRCVCVCIQHYDIIFVLI